MVVSSLFRLAKPLQPFKHRRIVCGNVPKRAASVHLRAVGTGIQPLLADAVMHGAEFVAERRFCALYAAAGAVYHFRRYRYAVQLCPQGSGFLAQGIVVRERCYSGVALFAVQPAAANKLIHMDLSLHRI